MYIWVSLIIFFYITLNWLIGRQIYDLLGINSTAFWLIFIILASSPVLGRVGPFNIFFKVGNLWMVFFYYAAVVAISGVFIKNKPLIIGCYLLIFLLIFIGSLQAKKIKVERYEIYIPKHASDLHVVMLSDIHIDKAKSSDYVEKMVEDINNFNPDIVFLAGDIFDDRDINILKQEQETLKKIKTRIGVYGVLGNHEHYSGKVNEIINILKEANITILRDQVIDLEGLYIVGREDVTKKRRDLNKLLETVDRDKPIFLLDHQPVSLEEAEKSGVDLQLSGHTHRGQFFPNNLITRKLFEVDHGYLAKDALQVIVSSGYGTWGPPVRIGTQSEIIDLYIKFN